MGSEGRERDLNKLRVFLLTLILFSGSALWAAGTVQLQVGQDHYLRSDTVLSVVNTYPSVISAEKYSNNEVKIQAKFPGEAYVHIFNYDNKITTYKVIVEGKKAPLPPVYGSSPISGHYSLYFKKDNDADYFMNKWMHTHEILVNSPTPLGQNTTRILYKSQQSATNDMKSQVAYFTTRFRDAGRTIVIGDDVISWSELMAPGLTYQGVRTQFTTTYLDVDLFAGDRGNEHWGEQVRDDVNAFQEVYGTRLTWKPGSSMNLFGAFLSQYDRDVRGLDKRLNDRSGGFSYQLDRNLLLSAEAASSVRKAEAFTAVRAQSIWQNESLMLDLTLRDLAADYETVSDWLDHRGQKGLYLRTRYRPTSYWSLWGAFDSFTKRFSLNYNNEDYDGSRSRISLALNKLPHVAPVLSVYRNIGHNNSWQGASLRFSEIDIAGELISFYYEFSPSVYDDETLLSNSFYEQQGLAGAVFRPWPLVELRIEHEYEYYVYNSGFRDDPHGINVIYNYGVFPFLGTTIKSIFSLRYQTRQNSERTTDQSLYSGSLQLRDAITSELSWYLRFAGVSQYIYHYDWETTEYEYADDKIRSEVAGGISYNF